MSATFECMAMNHLNFLVEDFDMSLEHFRDVFGAQFVIDIPREYWHACLLYVGGVLFEMFVPTEYLLNARLGPHYIGVELQVSDVDQARRDAQERGVRIIRELEHTFHTHPNDTYGVGWELFGRNFHTDPNIPWLEPLKPAPYWRDEHPLGLTGLKRYSIAVADIDGASAFVEDYLGARPLYEASRPGVAARAVGVQIADGVVELLTPTGDGALQEFLDRYGDGIRSTVFEVRDLEQARGHLERCGLAVHGGDAPDSLAIAPADNRGVSFEFSE